MPDVPHPRTLTHARLRRAQGDTRGAIEILESLIDAGDEGQELVHLYLALGGDTHRAHLEPELPHEEAPVPASLDTLADEFRRGLGSGGNSESIRRLQRWLTRIQRENR
jgi:hypothetical protein